MSKAHYLGRRIPTDFQHVDKYPLRALLTKAAIDTPVEVNLPLPYWHWRHDQGAEGSCVGFGCGMMMSITNEMENRAKQIKPYSEPYDCEALYRIAQSIDEYEDTPPEEGTSVRAGCDVMREFGLISKRRKSSGKPEITEGITENRWATTVDEMRMGLRARLPIAIGVNWYSNFDRPVQHKNGEWWIGEGNLGSIRGGHCVCLYRGSDKRQGFAIKNSWGRDYPLVWIGYDTMQFLLNEDGEAALITDRVTSLV